MGVEAAAQAVADVEAQLARWVSDGSTAEAELEDLRGRAGDEVLDDERAAARLAQAMTGLRSRIEIAQQAAEAATRRLDGARRQLLRAQAAELRERAARLRADADARQQKTDRLLVELREYEGVAFGPVPRYSPTGSVIGVAPLTKTEMLRNDAKRCEARALALDAAADGAAAEAVAQQAAALVAAGVG